MATTLPAAPATAAAAPPPPAAAPAAAAPAAAALRFSRAILIIFTDQSSTANTNCCWTNYVNAKLRWCWSGSACCGGGIGGRMH